MAQSKLRVSSAVTRSLEKAKARYPWARARVQVKGGIWCFETKRDAMLYQPQSHHELFTESESEKPKRLPQRRRR
jgi:hypothetical protein